MLRALQNPFRASGAPDIPSGEAGRGQALVGRLLSPEVGFPLLWLLGVALAQIRLFDFQEQGDWTLRVWVVMFMVPAAFLCGAALGRVGADALEARVRAPTEPSTRQWRQASLVLLTIGVLETVHQLVVAGGIPLLQDDIDSSRFALEGGPSVILTNCAPLAAAIALAAPRRLDPRECKVEFAVAIVGLASVALLGGRGQVILGIAVLVLLRAYRFGPPSLRFLGSALTVIGLFVAVVFFLRTRQNTGHPFVVELYSDVLPDTPSPLRVLVPLHVAITSNFEALAQVIANFPDRFAFGHGAYDAHGFDRVIPGSKQVSDVSAQLTPPFVTSTRGRSLWADGGFGWVAGGLAAIGALVAGVHRLATRTAASPNYTLPAAYLSYLAFFGIYTNLFTSHPDWVVITPLLFVTGAWLDGIRPNATLRRLSSYGVPLARRERLNLSTVLRDHRARVLAGLVAVLLVVAAAIVIGGTLGTDPGPAKVPTLVGQPAGTVPTPAGGMLSNGDGALDNEPLWTARRRASSVTLTGYTLAPERSRITSQIRFPARVRPSARLDISSWVGETRALFTLRPSRRGVDVEVWGSNARRVLSAGRAAEPSLLERGTRDVAIATHSGVLPDLYIIDRGVPNERARLAVYSGESSFRTAILKTRLPVVEVSAKDWTLDVGRASGDKPDVMLLARRGASGSPEMHVLSGDAGYQSFRIQHQVERLTVGATSDTSVRAVTVGGLPSAAVVSGSTGAPSRVTLLTLGARAGG